MVSQFGSRATITVEGTLTDSDGIEHWGYHLENEDTEVEIAEDEGDGAGNTEVSFTWTIEIPTDASLENIISICT